MECQSELDYAALAEILIKSLQESRANGNGIHSQESQLEFHQVLEQAGLGLCDRQQFRLLPDGIHVVRQIENCVARVLRDVEIPFWDRKRRSLLFRGAVLKSFDRPAPNQEAILDAFELAGWLESIPDPLDRDFEVHPADRLRDAIKRLNLSLRTNSIRFFRNGRGGVRWSQIIH